MIKSPRPTRVRYIILALTVCVAVLLYLDRYCLGYVTPYVKEDLGLSSRQTGFMLSAFFLTYAIGQLPGGWMADRFGTRWMLSIYLASWSILTSLTGFASGFLMLLVLRFGCGLFEAGAYPACAGLIRRWFPYQQRGLASGIVSLGGRIGGAIMPGLTMSLILVFTPLSAPSLIVNPERDILDPRGLARNVLLIPDADKKFPDFTQQIAHQLQLNLTPLQREVLVDFANRPTAAGSSKEQREFLAKLINDWLKTPDLLKGIDWEPIKPKLTRQVLGLLADPDTSTSEEKTTRLHRNALEVAFPEKIRQVLGDGWPPALMIFGVIGVVVAIIFFWFFRDTPRQHFLTNEAEAELAEAHEKAHDADDPPMPASTLWWSILTDRSLWASSIVQFGTNFGWIILGNQLALYLHQVHQVPEGAEKSLMVSLPFFVALPTLIIGGWWTDWMTKKYGPRIGRCFPVASTRFATAAAFAMCWFLEGAWPVVIVLCIMSFVHDLGLPALWGYNLDVGKRNVGLVLGWGNMWGNFGAALSPYVLVPLPDFFESKKAGYEVIFLICAGVFIVIGFVSLLIDASKPIGMNENKA
ncbi:MAG: MFS transporter [Gemmataceae bacterium]|nr:MFS transporter [Gemmataceae bacterium]